MSTIPATQTQSELEKANNVHGHDHAELGATHATKQRAPYNYGGNPLAREETNDGARLPAFGGDFQPGSYRVDPHRKFANPAPLGLCGFALTTFLLSVINLGAHDLSKPNIVIGAAFGYGGLVQLLAGMWEMAVGNTFGATALSSYGGFWIGTAIILTPGGFGIESAEGTEFAYAFGVYLLGWFIFTTILLFCTLRSTLAFFLLFFTLDMAFLTLGVGYLYGANVHLIRAGGAFGIIAAFLAWYNAFAGLASPNNSFILAHVVHFPWSDKGREARANNHTAATQV